MVVAHRGDWRNAPENSLPAILSCIRMGCDIVEIDVRLSKDSVPILIHDATLDRTTTGKGKVSDFTLKELKKLYLRDGLGSVTPYRIITLEEAMIVARDQILVNIDKATDYFDRVKAVLVETQTTSQVILKSGKSYSELEERYGKRLEGMIYMPIIGEKTADPERFVTDFQTGMSPLAYEVLFTTEDSPTLALLHRLKQEGCRIWVNTLWPHLNGGHDDEKALQNADASWGWLIRQGTDILQTDRPSFMLEYLRKRGLHD